MTAKTSKPSHKWVPLIEGARMVARLAGNEAPCPPKVRAEAAAKLLEALRLGLIASRGDLYGRGQVKRISERNWQSMRADIDNSRLLSMTRSWRRYPPDGYVNVEVIAPDIQRILGPAAEAKANFAVAMQANARKSPAGEPERLSGPQPVNQGRPKGTGYRDADKLLFCEIDEKMSDGAPSLTMAISQVIGRDGSRAKGSGCPESKIKRIAGAYKLQNNSE